MSPWLGRLRKHFPRSSTLNKLLLLLLLKEAEEREPGNEVALAVSVLVAHWDVNEILLSGERNTLR